MNEKGKVLTFPAQKELSPRLVRKEPEKASKLFNALSLKEQLELVLSWRAKDRLNLILLSQKAKALVRLLPSPELYLTIKEVGEEDSLELLALANHRQLTYIFDLEFWKEQTLSPQQVCRWLDLLQKASLEQFRSWLKQADIELLITILQKLVRVYVPDPDNLGAEPWRNKELFTLDEYYYLEIKEEKFRPLVEALLLHLRDIEQERYYGILDQVRWQVPAEIEDISWRVRQGRLEDYGFYDFDEAFEIYRFVPDARIPFLETKTEFEIPLPSPRYPLAVPDKIPNFLRLILEELGEKELEEFYAQFARLANKVMIADVMDLTELSSIKKAVEKVYGYLEIGLEFWSEGNLERALEIFRGHWLEQIFQVGFSQVLKLRFRAQKIEAKEWFRALGKPFYLFGAPLAGILKALLAPRPRYYDAQRNEMREFKDFKEVKKAEAELEQAEFLLWLFFEVLGLKEAELKTLLSCYQFELNFPVILATAMVKGVVGGRLSFAPLSPQELSQFLAQSMPLKDDKRTLEQNLKESFKQWLVRRVEQRGAREKKFALLLAERVFEMLGDELGMIKEPEKINPELITCLVLE